ncbi:MAG TPA: nucleotide exchange factor GrpE [Frankiaceae bacterium]|jgi:hypothetical protein|nr:nucleotide exchange factor GrpE [Frankiaceae bacterium]
MSHALLADRAGVIPAMNGTSGPALSTTGWLITAGLCVLAIALGTAVGHRWGRRRVPDVATRPQPIASTLADALPVSLLDALPETLPAERAALVQAVIRIRTLTADPAIREIADDGLAESGVVTIVPTGERFDPRLHQSVGELPTADPAQDCIIARTDRPGFEDHGRRIRPAEVLVLRFQVV